jgi:hypothetical protein
LEGAGCAEVVVVVVVVFGCDEWKQCEEEEEER